MESIKEIIKRLVEDIKRRNNKCVNVGDCWDGVARTYDGFPKLCYDCDLCVVELSQLFKEEYWRTEDGRM